MGQPVNSPTSMALTWIKSTWPGYIKSSQAVPGHPMPSTSLVAVDHALRLVSEQPRPPFCWLNPKPCMPPGGTFSNHFLPFPIFMVVPLAAQQCLCESTQLLNGSRWENCVPALLPQTCGKTQSPCPKRSLAILWRCPLCSF